MKLFPFFALISLLFISCDKPADNEPSTNNSQAKLRFKFEFDENQTRLNNLGLPATIPEGNAAQTPDFKQLSIHVLDLTPNRFTPYGQGFIAYKGAETTAGGSNAVDFEKAILAENGEIFIEVPLNSVPVGTYEYSRVSVSYQNYDVKFNVNNIPLIGDLTNQRGTIASFLGFNNYIGTVQVNEQNLTVNDDKLQGFWAFETQLSAPYEAYNQLSSGESAGSTTVVNPIAGDSDIPAGSCVVTGAFDEALTITGEETEDITITLSFSINDSFEWQDLNGNGEMDFYGDGTEAEKVVDMGLRGLEVRFE